MNFQDFVGKFREITCVISVKKIADDKYTDIRIVAGNKPFIDMVEHPMYLISPDTERGATNIFIPDSPYHKYLPKSLNFEDVCYRSAIRKESIHTYIHIHPNNLDIWLNVFAMPINYEYNDTYYCTYTTALADISNINPNSTQSNNIAEDVLKYCLKLYNTLDFEKTMKEVVKDTRIICGAEICSIMLIDFSLGKYSILAQDLKPGCTVKTVTQFKNFFDVANTWINTIGESDCIIIKSDADMEYISKINNAWYLTLKEAGVDSVVLFPLKFNNEVLGFIWATNFDTSQALHIKEVLELMTFFLSSHISSYNLIKRLEHTSYTDLLTGVHNRNSMNNTINNIINGTKKFNNPYGIVFADLNGLKLINDSKGHHAGDLLLKKAALTLLEVFTGCEVYRSGGDEFMILVLDYDEKKFNQKVATLKKISQDSNNICFAIGAYYNNTNCDIRAAIRIADENMYKDKHLYYQLFPKLKRK